MLWRTAILKLILYELEVVSFVCQWACPLWSTVVMLMHTWQGFLEVSVQQYVQELSLAQYSLKDVAFTHIGFIFVSVLVFLPWRVTYFSQWVDILHICQQRSYVYPIYSELAPTHMSSPSFHWQHSVSSFLVAHLENFDLFFTNYHKVKELVRF